MASNFLKNSTIEGEIIATQPWVMSKLQVKIFDYGSAITSAEIKQIADEGKIILVRYYDAIYQYAQGNSDWVQFVKMRTDLVIDEISLTGTEWEIRQNRVFDGFTSLSETDAWVERLGANALGLLKEGQSKTFKFTDTSMQGGYPFTYNPDGTIKMGTYTVYGNNTWNGNLKIVVDTWLNGDAGYGNVHFVPPKCGTALDFILLTTNDGQTDTPVSQIIGTPRVIGAKSDVSFAPDFNSVVPVIYSIISSDGNSAFKIVSDNTAIDERINAIIDERLNSLGLN